MKYIAILTCALFGISPIYAQSLAQSIDSILSIKKMDSLPGGAILVQQNDSILYTKYFGKADLSNQIDIDHETVFNIGSVSKQFTVFAILLLEEEGKLSLQDNIRKYIPELYAFRDTITIEHLIRHTSGLKTVNFLARMAGWRQTDLSTHDQMMKLIFRQKNLDFAPGTEYKYSNTGTMLLAEIIKRVSGFSFGEFMQQEVFQPLKMDQSFVREDIGEIFQHEAHGYFWQQGRLKKAINPHESIGYSNVYSNVLDLAKWASNFKQQIVGNQRIFDKMESPTLLRNGTKVEHAMGQFITPYKGTEQIQHTGGHRAYVTYLGRFTEYDLNIIICSNLEGFDLFGNAYKIADLFIPSEEVSDEISSSANRHFFELSKQEVAKFHGYYWLDGANISRKIFSRNDTLIYSRGPNNESYFKAIDTNEFLMLGSNSEITITFHSDKMVFNEPSGRSEFEKYQPISYSIRELNAFTGLYYSHELNAAYEIVLDGSSLKAKSPKMKDIVFSPVMANLFITNQWFLNKAKFIKDDMGNITGFYASNVQVNQVWFKKLE